MATKQPNRAPREGLDLEGRTPLHYAAAGSRLDEVSRLLKAGAVVDTQDDNGWSALHFAAQAGASECVAELLRAGADVSLQDSYGNTALFRAVFCSRGDGAVIRMLRQAGADPRVKNKHGVSPLLLAHTMANYNVAQFFADVGEVE
jgi:ankyrin repeat protein